MHTTVFAHKLSDKSHSALSCSQWVNALDCKPSFPLWAPLSDVHIETHSRRYGLVGVTMPAAQGQKHSRAQGCMMRTAGRKAPITHTAYGGGPKNTASLNHCIAVQQLTMECMLCLKDLLILKITTNFQPHSFKNILLTQLRIGFVFYVVFLQCTSVVNHLFDKKIVLK